MTQCIVTINGTEDFLLPKKQALQLVDLISQSKNLRRGFGKKHQVQNQPYVQLETITDNELTYNEEVTPKGATQ